MTPIFDSGVFVAVEGRGAHETWCAARCGAAHAMRIEPTPRRLHLLVALLGTDLGTEQGEIGANKCDTMTHARLQNAFDRQL